MKFDYDLVGTGWAWARISHGDSTADITASYLVDALGDLLLAVWTLTEGARDARCSWAEEPGEYRWLFRIDGDHVDVHILQFDDLWTGRADERGRTVFRAAMALRVLVEAVAQAATEVERRYGRDGYRDKWVEYGFPADTLAELQRWLQ